MKLSDFAWDVFKHSGDIESYMLYHEMNFGGTSEQSGAVNHINNNEISDEEVSFR